MPTKPSNATILTNCSPRLSISDETDTLNSCISFLLNDKIKNSFAMLSIINTAAKYFIYYTFS